MFVLRGQRLLHKGVKIFRLTYRDFSALPDMSKLLLVRTLEKKIEDNTSVFIESPIHVKVQPIDYHDTDAHGKLIMKLYSSGKVTSDFQVKQTAKRLDLYSKAPSPDQTEDMCIIQMPFNLKVQVTTTQHASVQLDKLEGDDFIIKTEKGAVEIGDLKAQNIKVETTEGPVYTKGKLQASSIELKSGAGSEISCNNILAHSFYVSTHTGSISVKSCYSDKSHFTTLLGNIRLDHLHRSVTIDIIQQGNLHITSFSGNLQASLKSGDVYMLVSQLTEKSSIFIHEKGKVELLVPDIVKNLPATNLIAEKIVVDDKIMKLGRFMDDSHPKRFRFEKEPQNELHVVCKNGSIELKEINMPFMI